MTTRRFIVEPRGLATAGLTLAVPLAVFTLTLPSPSTTHRRP